MNNKNKGFLLFEFLITSLLAGTLLIIVYQSYQTANRGVQYIKNNADLEMQKILLFYQLELDSIHIIIPNFVYDLYPQIKNHFNKNKKDNPNKKINQEIIPEENNDQIKKLEKEFKIASLFFPEVVNTNEEIKISWISTRKILNKNSLVKINYLFKLTDKIYKEKNLYRLYRREDPLERDYSIKKKGNEYTFITYISNPEINIIMPNISTLLKEKKENLEKNKNDLFEWTKNPTFIAQRSLPKIEFKEMHKKALIPFTVFITGTMITYNMSKELDMQITVNFPIANYALQRLFNNESDINDKKLPQKANAPQLEKNNTLLNQSAVANFTPISSNTNLPNNFNTI